MSLLSAWALAGLILAAPLILLHLRRRRPPTVDVPSLLAWRQLPAPAPVGRGRFSPPLLPILLALQLLALALLVFSLARPASGESTHAPGRVYVVDESIWMGAQEAGGTRIDAARELLRQRLAKVPAGEAVAIVAAGPDPSVLFEGLPGGATGALGDLRASAGPAALDTALRLAAGLRQSAADPVLLVRAPEDAAPKVSAPKGGFAQTTVGGSIDNQSVSWTFNCPPFTAGPCEALAAVTNEGPVASVEQLEVSAAGKPALERPVSVGPGGTSRVAFSEPRGTALEAKLAGGDALAADNRAFAALPTEGGERITLVGDRQKALPLARALGSIPGVKLRLRTPQTYRDTDPATSELLVLDDWLPPGGLPDAPGLLLVDPPRLPGGAVDGPLEDSRLSGENTNSSLLNGVDLSSLTVYKGGARRLELPPGLAAAAWSPEGPLLAAGSVAGQRLAVLALDPGRSNLAQLAGFPLLIANVVGWSQEWAPARATPGAPVAVAVAPGTESVTLEGGGADRRLAVPADGRLSLTIPRAGNYTLAARGPGGVRSRAIAVSAGSGEIAAGEAAAGTGEPVRAAGGGPAAPGRGTAGAPVDLHLTAGAIAAGHHHLWPWFLAAALLVLLLEAAYAMRREPRGSPRRRLALGLQVASLVLLALALVNPSGSGKAPPTTLVVDRSLSVGDGSVAAERDWLAARSECGEECRIVQFGGAPALTGADQLPARAGGPLAAGETNLRRALELAVARTPRGGRVVVLSDGFETTAPAFAATGDAFDRSGAPSSPVLADALAREVTIDAAPLTAAPPDIGVTRVEAPPALHAGDPFSLQVNVRATTAASATITLSRGGERTGGETVKLAKGDNPYLFSLRAPAGPGSYSYEVSVKSAGGGRPQNDTLATTLRVTEPPSVLVATSGEAPIAALLEEDGMKVTTVAPEELPAEATAYAGTDAVVLEDVSAAALGDERAAALAEAVHSEALGLFVLGGEGSFSLGRYYGSPLQAALPVTSLEPGSVKRRNVAVELIIDRSGSMVDEVGNVPKIYMAQAAAEHAVRLLARNHDQVGVVSFDARPHLLVPVTRLTSPAIVHEIEAKIEGLLPEGGTDIYRALEAGAQQIEATKARSRHIILLSDGISEPGSYQQLLPGLAADHITVATVALGSEADFKLLRAVAKETGGNYYLTNNSKELPKIFAKETKLSVRPVRLRGQIGVSAGASSPVVSSLLGKSLPALGGNVVTTLKPGATAGLLGQDKGRAPDPVLAQWQYGTGRVVVWTPGLEAESAGPWRQRPRLFQDAARWVERGVEPPPLTPVLLPGGRALEVATEGAARVAPGTAALAGSLRTPTGKQVPLRFDLTSPRHYVAPLPKLGQGVYGYAIAARANLAGEGALAIPYPAEYRLGNPEATPLGPLAAASGGSVLAPGDPAALGGGESNLWWWLALAALLCFLAGAALRLLDAGGGTARRERRQNLRPRADPSRQLEPDRV